MSFNRRFMIVHHILSSGNWMLQNMSIITFIILTWFHGCVSSNDIINIYSGGHQNKYFTGNVSESFSPIGYIQCQKKCYAYSDCSSINYHKDNLYCELLKENITVLSDLEDKDGFLYKTMSKQNFKEQFVSCH